jgi:hypothetical protein
MASQGDSRRQSQSSPQTSAMQRTTPGQVQTGIAQHSTLPSNTPATSQMSSQQLPPASIGASKPPPPLKQSVLGLVGAASTTAKSTKQAVPVPSKQSPVPLPPNIMAAMRSSAAPGPARAAPALPGPVNPATAVSEPRQLTAVDLKTGTRPQQSSSSHASSPAQTTSHVPIPSSVVTPHQHAAQLAGPARTGMPIVAEVATAHPEAADEAGLQTFPDVPAESMQFVERLMGNLRRLSQQRGAST